MAGDDPYPARSLADSTTAPSDAGPPGADRRGRVPSPFILEPETVDALRGADLRPYLAEALRGFESGAVRMPDRGAVDLRPGGAVTHVMTARDVERRLVVTKVIDYDPDRRFRTRGERATSAGLVLLLHDGEPLMITPADRFTGIRTGATAAFAIDGLMTPGPLDVAVIGPGLVGSETLRALAAQRELSSVRLIGRDPGRLRSAVGLIESHVGGEVVIAKDVGSLLDGATVLVTATSSTDAVVAAADLSDDVQLIAALGAGIAERRELATDVIAGAARVFVDSVHGAATEAGDLIIAAREGFTARPEPLGAGLVEGPAPGLRIYKSVGSAWQDLACALAVLDRVRPGWR
jgi:ornithine cyclodeaminase/alanine dehydrogenase-like protein (mu-crystallin family)